MKVMLYLVYYLVRSIDW